MKRTDIDAYNDIYRPRFNRRQQIAFNAFHGLNRERQYISTSLGALPLNITKAEIRACWDELITPIAFNFFLVFINALDDVFVEHSREQAKAAGNG